MGADILFLILVVYGLVFGLRRGFYKELIAFTALVVAFGAARTWRAPAGNFIAAKVSFLSPIAPILGALIVWVVAFFVINLIGRLILKKLRDPDRENTLEQAADGVADAAEGKEPEGPVTLLTNPIAKAHKSFVYWTDKLIGGLLGVVKGAAAAYAIFAVVYFVDLRHPGTFLSGMKDSIESSRAAALYTDVFAGLIRDRFPEYKVIENAAATERLVNETEQHKDQPQLIERLAAMPNWSALKATQAFRDLAADPEVQAAWTKVGPDGKRDLRALLRSKKVRHLLADESFEQAFADTDVEGVIRAAANPPEATKK